MPIQVLSDVTSVQKIMTAWGTIPGGIASQSGLLKLWQRVLRSAYYCSKSGLKLLQFFLYEKCDNKIYPNTVVFLLLSLTLDIRLPLQRRVQIGFTVRYLKSFFLQRNKFSIFEAESHSEWIYPPGVRSSKCCPPRSTDIPPSGIPTGCYIGKLCKYLRF